MKFNISNMTVALAAAALGAASCTANYEDINRNPYEVTAEDMERDGYAMRSFMTTMQSWVIPADVNQCQFTDLLLGGPYGGYIADANSGFNTGKFSTYDPQSNWSPVFYRVIYTNEMSNFTELCKVTEDENAIAVAKVVKVAGVHRVAADIASFMNGYDDPRRASYFNESAFSGGGYDGLRNGIQIPDDDRINNFSRYNVTASTSLMWMNASEVAFLRAEGALRGWAMGGNARTFYEEGIRLSFERCGVADQLTAYMASTALPGGYDDPAFGYSCSNQSTVTIPWNDGAAFEENLERIITQKWIANFPLGTEAWADYRRTGYPRLFPVVVNNNPDITNLQLGARRMTYPLEEYEANGETIRAAVDQWLGGQDKMSTRLWWDCNPRIR